MRVICGGRKTGRTTALIEACAEAEARGEVSYMVCKTHAQAISIKKKAEELGLFIRFPIVYDELINKKFNSIFTKHVFIDNADQLLQYIVPVHIDTIIVEKSEVDET